MRYIFLSKDIVCSKIGWPPGPTIIGFRDLTTLLKWHIKSEKIAGVMDKRFLPNEFEKIYFKYVPIVTFRREQINKEKIEQLFSDFENQRNEVKNSPPRNKKYKRMRDPLGDELSKLSERRGTHFFVDERKDMKYFSICRVEQIEIKKSNM